MEEKKETSFFSNTCVCTRHCVPVCVLSHSYVSDSLQPYGLWPARLFCPWDSLGKNTGVDCHLFLQGIFPTQGSDTSPALQADSLLLSHLGSPIVCEAQC